MCLLLFHVLHILEDFQYYWQDIAPLMQLGLRSDADEDSWGKWQGDGQHEDEQYWLANGYSKEDIEEWKKKKREKRKQQKARNKDNKNAEWERSQMAKYDPADQWIVVNQDT